MDACQKRFLEALERTAEYSGITSRTLALYHIVGAMMGEHHADARVEAALSAIKARDERSAR